MSTVQAANERSTTEATEPTGILPAAHWQQAAQDDDEDDEESQSLVSTDSVRSSIFSYRKIHGRTYHHELGNANYWASNDDKQNESLDINHHALTLACHGKLHLAPLEKDKISKALDIGTGTGIWAIDFADENPGVEVIGTDISPIQPSWVPPNLKFEMDDCTREWTFAADSIDYIHLRWLIGSIGNWHELLAQAFRCCRPGGWVESLEPSPFVASDDGSVKDTSALGQWGKIFVEGGKKLGVSFTVVEEGTQRKAMEAAGFVDIQEFNFKASFPASTLLLYRHSPQWACLLTEHYLKTPHGGWPKDPLLKELGEYSQLVLLSDIEGYVLFIANALGWSEPEIQVYIARLRNEVKSNRYHSYYRQKVVWGRKPG